jgi:hypothetical protein
MAHYDFRTVEVQVAKLEAKPGDVVLLWLPAGCSEELKCMADKALAAVLPKGVARLILERGFTFTIVDAKAAVKIKRGSLVERISRRFKNFIDATD